MIIRLLNTQPESIPSFTVKNNLINGNDSENYAAVMLLSALRAEISWSSRNEDSKKIDLICSFDHPWHKDRVILLVQVKSGNSYGEVLPDGFKLKSTAKKLAVRTTHPICIVWVDAASNESYWAYIIPQNSEETQTFGNNHKVNPCMRYDITRLQSNYYPIKEGGSGIIMKEAPTDFKNVRDRVNLKYLERKNKPVKSPNIGDIEFTRIGWRHMFRITRSWRYKQNSLTVIPYLENILRDKASETYIRDVQFYTQKTYEYRRTEYVLRYKNVKLLKDDKSINSVDVVVRVIEEIRWPKEWRNLSLLSSLVNRRVVLLSVGYKPS